MTICFECVYIKSKNFKTNISCTANKTAITIGISNTSICIEEIMSAVNCTGILHISISSCNTNPPPHIDDKIREGCFKMCLCPGHVFNL
jgi:hypothetical protein